MSGYIERRKLLRSIPVAVLTVAGAGSSVSAARSTGEGDETEQVTTTGTYTETKQLVPGDGDDTDTFGATVAVSDDGTTAVVGAYQDEDPNGKTAGSAYVFTKSSSGWSQQDKLTAEDGDTEDQFGKTVAVSGDGTTALVGAPTDEDPNGTDAGAVYVFTASSGSWSQQQKITPGSGNMGDMFGGSVSLSTDGTTALIGASGDEDPNGRGAGSAYIFTASSGSWSKQEKLLPSDGDSADSFGNAVALSGDSTTAVVCASGDEDPNGQGGGSAYVFGQSSGSWSQQDKLLPKNGDSGDVFGNTVAVSDDGTTAVVGAKNDEDPNGSGAGAAYVFGQSNGSWSQQTRLAEGDDSDNFGESVALSGDGTTALVGARIDEDPNGKRAGSAYLFDSSSGSWSRQQKISASDGDSEDQFGVAVSLSDDKTTAIVGASVDEDPNGPFSGSAYAFEQSSNNTAPQADAGTDQTVTEQKTVTLDASGSSDPDGDSLSYSWKQTGGTSVSLSNSKTATPTFTAPSVSSSTTLTFEVTVSDGNKSDTDSTTVTVTDDSSGSSAFQIDSVGIENQYAGDSAATIPSGEAVQGEIVDIVATVTNTSSSAASESIVLTFGNNVVSKTVSISNVSAGASEKVYMKVRLGTLSPGTYSVTASTGGTTQSTDIKIRQLGDTNHDGSVGPGDATKAQKRIVGINPSGNYNPAAADTTQDKTVGPGDVTRIQKTIVGLFDPQDDLNLSTEVRGSGTK